MAHPLQVGITGGIGSGKSLVCSIFKALGIPVYDADSHAKELMTTDGILVQQIKKEFGELSFHEDGSLNRGYLSKAVFNDVDKLERLNRLVHPRVGEDYARWVNQNANSPYVLKEAALLFEAGSHQTLDKVMVVVAPEALRIERVLQRDPQRTTEQIKAIIRNQMPEEEKMKRADHVIVNNETELLIPQVVALHHQFLSATASSRS
ncbi:dephospho-CoA kinase [Chryseolinea lacunae]|uniref:dephospho-CoA kinase n=1 Tax=Chryseolinea lacunae TaxID=2801331 RepID=UPI0034E1C7A8